MTATFRHPSFPGVLVAKRALGPLVHGELDCLCDELSEAERGDVREMLDLIGRRLAARSEGIVQFRSRLDAVIASLIGVVDALDGDCDLDQSAIETHGAGFCLDPLGDEGEESDNGLGDYAGHDEQMSCGYGLT
jgi:hypothetical protein